MNPDVLWWSILGFLLSICGAGPGGIEPPEPPWTPASLPSVVAFVDAREGLEVADGGAVTGWAEQITGETLLNTYVTDDSRRPTKGVVGVHFAPASPYVPAQWLRASGQRMLPNGLTFWWVSRYTSTKSVHNHSQNCPLTVMSESSVNTFVGAGFSGDALCYSVFTSSGWSQTTFGSGYNDGAARLFVVSHATDGTLTAYVDGAQVGTTTKDYYATYMSWSSIGTGYRAEPTDTYGGDDGMDGDVSAAGVEGAPITADALAHLVTWTDQQGLVP